jgi:predicted HTH domain antitoxin
MASIHLDLGDELGALVSELGQPVEQAAREMIVLELYRRSVISSGKGAELLSIPRVDLIQRASDLGIPYFRLSEEEWQAEIAQSKQTRSHL